MVLDNKQNKNERKIWILTDITKLQSNLKLYINKNRRTIGSILSDGRCHKFGHVRTLRPDGDLHGHAVRQGQLGSHQNLEAASENT